MSTIQQKEKLPSIFTYNDTLYDFDNFKTKLDDKVNDYIQLLRRGNRDYNEFFSAYSNLMLGILNGTLKINNGKFIDSTGKYTNGVYYDNNGERRTTKRLSKDYYGLMANFIKENLAEALEYKTPEPPEDKSKIKWTGKNSLGIAFNRRIFNLDTPNIQDFRDLYNPELKEDKRIDYLSKTINYLRDKDNFDNMFTGYTDKDYNDFYQNSKDILSAIADKQIQAGDYLSLNKTFGGIDWRRLFSNTDEEETKKTEVANSDSQLELKLTIPQQFYKWLDETMPDPGTPFKEISLKPHFTYTPEEVSTLNTALRGLSNDQLLSIARLLATGSHYTFSNELFLKDAFKNKDIRHFVNPYALYSILPILKEKNLLSQLENPDLYYIPDTAMKDTNRAVVWDSKNNLIKLTSIRDIPYWRLVLVNKFKDYYSTQQGGWALPYLQKAFTSPVLKEGGILKATDGTSFNNIYAEGESPDIDYNTYLNKIFSLAQVLDLMKALYNGDFNLYAAAVKKNVNNRFLFGINNYNNNTTYTGDEAIKLFNTGYLNNGKTFNYVLFGNNDNDYNSKKNGVLYNLVNFYRPEKALNTGDRYNTDPTKAYIDDALGLQTYSRVMSLTDPNIKDFGEWGKYWQNNGATGAYYYISGGDNSGKGQWIPTNLMEISGYRPFKPLYDEKKDLKTKSVTEPKKDVKKNTFKVPFKLKSPDLPEIARKLLSIRTNNEIGDVLKRMPVTKDSYELYLPLLGDLPSLHYYNKQGIDLMNLALNVRTSDPTLYMANLFEANKEANNLQQKGYLADNNSIRLSFRELLARKEKGVANRTEVANFNSASANQTNRENLEIEATRLKRNWESENAYMEGLASKLKEEQNRKDLFNLLAGLNDIEDLYNKAMVVFKKAILDYKNLNLGNSISNMPNYYSFLNDLNQWKQALQFKLQSDLFNISYNNQWLNKTPSQLLAKYRFAKQGGVLFPNTLYLIKKDYKK